MHPSKMEVKLYSSNKEREQYENMADIYAIFVAMEGLEKAYIRDAVTADKYTPACAKLIAQFKTAMNLLGDSFSIQKFMSDYKMSFPAATRRLVHIGVPATIEHSTGSNNESSSGSSAKHVAEAVQLFITLMDSLKLNMRAVDQIHPLLSDLMVALNQVSLLPADYDGKGKVREWLIVLNKMRAADELDEEQTRQILFDLENAHNAFYRSLSR